MNMLTRKIQINEKSDKVDLEGIVHDKNLFC